VRKEIFDQVCDEGFNVEKGSFTQYYGSDELDASLLMIPLVGFLPAHDPRVRGTIEAVERELVEGGFVLRYRTVDTGDVDGLSGREGAFLACSFWLADCLSLLGRDHDARQLLDRLLGLRNDLGLLSEEYDPVAGRLVGNFPQAFSHVSLVNTASKMGGQEKPSSSHVIAGLARRALTEGKGRTPARHMGAFDARNMLSRLVESADTDVSGRAAQVVQQAIGNRPPSGAIGGPKPTRKPSAKRPTALATKAPTKASAAAATQGRRTATTKKVTKRATATKTAPPKRVATRKPSARKASARRASATKAAAKKATATKTMGNKAVAPAGTGQAKNAAATKKAARKSVRPTTATARP
jgi:hypothetical protein